MKRYLLIITFIFILIVSAFFCYINSLQFKLNNAVKNKNCITGIAIIKDNQSVVINNKKLPLLSVFKFFIAVKVLDKLEKENIKLSTLITVEKTMINENMYSPMLKKYNSYPFKISISDLMQYMISESDNNASDILSEYSGGMQELEHFIHNLGFEEIELKVNEKEMNKDIYKQYLNRAYPYDVIKFMKTIREGSILSNEHKDFLDKLMINTETGQDKLKLYLPDDVIIGHKTGSSSRTEEGIKIADNDAGFIILPDGGTYYIAVMAANSKMSDKENSRLIAKISEIVYKNYSPKFITASLLKK